MKKALIRLEDIGPGGEYGTEERLMKLCVVADFLAREGVPFHVAMIPRFVDPSAGYDKSISEKKDPYVQKFRSVLAYLRQCGGSIGLHGYTHQYGKAVSAQGYEFFYSACEQDCPPEEFGASYLEREVFEHSYTSSRMRSGLSTADQAEVPVDWFETPHYAAEGSARHVLESWIGVFFENDPRHQEANKRVVVEDIDTPLYRGAVYVPTPLFYVDGAHPKQDVDRMCREIETYAPQDLAGFFFHAFLEFPFIKLEQTAAGKMRVRYDESSHLHRLIRRFTQRGWTFVPMLSVVPFAPSARKTDVMPGHDVVVLPADLDGDASAELLFWEHQTGEWSMLRANLDGYPNRNIQLGEPQSILSGWAQGAYWKPFIGDVNGDGRQDVIVLDTNRGQWQVAQSAGGKLVPAVGDRNFLWLENFAVGADWVPLVGDFNGDGKTDVAAYHRTSGELRVALSTGAHFAEVFVAGAGVAGTSAKVPHSWLKGWVKGTDWNVAVGDFNGDGRSDLVAWNSRTGDWKVALSDGKRLTPTLGHLSPYWRREFGVGERWQLLTGDVDGDGRDDVLLVDPVQGLWLIARNARDRFVPLDLPFGPWAAGEYAEPFIGNFTSDRRAAIGMRQSLLRGGTVDFAVSLMGRKNGWLPA